MVFSSAKFFTIVENESLESLAKSLQGKRTSRVFREPDGVMERDLVFDVEGVEYDEATEIGRGTLKMDYARVTTDRDGEAYVSYGCNHVSFWMKEDGNRRLIVHANQVLANSAANTLSHMLWGRGGHIVQKFFETSHIQAFIDANPNVPQKVNWSGLTIPGTNSATLEGQNVGESPDFNRYEALGGRKSFVRLKLVEGNIVLSLSAEGIVTFHTPLAPDQIEAFIIDRILPIL